MEIKPRRSTLPLRDCTAVFALGLSTRVVTRPAGQAGIFFTSSRVGSGRVESGRVGSPFNPTLPIQPARFDPTLDIYIFCGTLLTPRTRADYDLSDLSTVDHLVPYLPSSEAVQDLPYRADPTPETRGRSCRFLQVPRRQHALDHTRSRIDLSAIKISRS